MRVLCGRCGRVNKLDDDFAGPSAECSECGRAVPVPRLGADVAAPPAVELHEEEGSEALGFADRAREFKGPKIAITCPHCGKSVKVGAKVAGMRARCKGCDKPLRIPYPDDLQEFVLPTRDGAERAVVRGLDLLPPAEPARPAEAPPAAEAPAPAVAEPVAATIAAEEAEEAEALEPADVPHPAAEAVAIEPVAELAGLDLGAHLAALDRARATGAPAPARAPRPEPVHAIEDEQLVGAAKEYKVGRAFTRPPEPARSPTRTMVWILLLVIGAAAIAVPAVIVVPILLDNTPVDDIDIGPAIGPTSLPTPRPVPSRDANKGGPAVAVDPNTRPPPRRREPLCRIVAVETKAFAADGYFATGPGSVYCKVVAEVTAGEQQVDFRTRGGDVLLTAGGEAYASLGTPASLTAVPTLSRQAAVSLGPGRRRRVSFLFELPAAARKGTLTVQGLPPRPVELPPPAALPAAAGLAGTYVEQTPRNLRPLLRDPVMAAIQAAPDHKLLLAADGDRFEVALPAATVRGLAEPIGPGLYRTRLHYGRDVLTAKLRFMQGGHQLVLYLADEPFHQLAFVNPAIDKPKPPAPVPTAPTTRRTTRPTTRRGPAATGPGIGSKWQDVPGYDPNAKPDKNEKLPTGPSIFD